MASEPRCKVCGLLEPHICLRPELVLFQADQFGAYRSPQLKRDWRKERTPGCNKRRRTR